MHSLLRNSCVFLTSSFLASMRGLVFLGLHGIKEQSGCSRSDNLGTFEADFKLYDIDEGPPPLPPFPPPETAQCDPREPSSLCLFQAPVAAFERFSLTSQPVEALKTSSLFSPGPRLFKVTCVYCQLSQKAVILFILSPSQARSPPSRRGCSHPASTPPPASTSQPPSFPLPPPNLHPPPRISPYAPANPLPHPQGKMGPRLHTSGPAEPSLPGVPQPALNGETYGEVGYRMCSYCWRCLGSVASPFSLPSSRGYSCPRDPICCCHRPSPLDFVSSSHRCDARALGAGSQLRTPSSGCPLCLVWGPGPSCMLGPVPSPLQLSVAQQPHVTHDSDLHAERGSGFEAAIPRVSRYSQRNVSPNRQGCSHRPRRCYPFIGLIPFFLVSCCVRVSVHCMRVMCTCVHTCVSACGFLAYVWCVCFLCFSRVFMCVCVVSWCVCVWHICVACMCPWHVLCVFHGVGVCWG